MESRLLFSGLGFADPLLVSPIDAPDFVTAGDFDGDAKIDLVTSSFNGGGLTLLRGTGKGGFKATGTIDLSTPPDFVTSADINGDQKRDVLTVSFNAGIVTVLLGHGDGTFASPKAYSTPGARALVLGDFTGDSVLDVIVAKSFNTGLTMLPGLPQGKFNPAFKQTTTFVPSDIVAGDFDKDGQLDLAAIDFFDDTLHILRNTGGGLFQVSQSVATGAGPTSVTAADFNGDNKLDIATADFLKGGASVFLNNGNGTFGAAAHLSSGQALTFALAADINDDQKSDLLVANATDDTISGFVSNGNGTFQPAVDFGTETSPRAIAVADFNRDGHLDFASTNQGASSLTVVDSDRLPPQASMPTRPAVKTPTASPFEFTITYTDDLAFGPATLGDDDISVTGPKSFSAGATFVSSKAISQTTRTAIYRVSPPGGFWEPSDDGVYQVSVRAGGVSDTSGNAMAAGKIGEFDATVSDVGNTTATADSFGNVSPGVARAKEEYIGIQDRNDIYRFRVTKTAEVYVKAYQMSDDADLQLLDASGARIQYSKRSGSAVEFVRRTLSPGTYYVRVLFTYGIEGTGYRLRLEASTPIPTPTDNNSPQTATNLGPLSPGQVKVIEKAVSINDRNDYYRIELGSDGRVQFKLTGLIDDADLQLQNSQGTAIATSKKSSTSDESFTPTLTRGTYFVRVIFKNGVRYTPYRLRIAAL